MSVAIVATRRRTVTHTGRADDLAELLRRTYAAGRLATRPQDVASRFDEHTGTWSIRFDVIEPVAPSAASRLWARPTVRRAVYVLAVLAGLLLAGRVTWLLFGAQITAAVVLVAKAAVLPLLLAAFMAGRRRGCPGASSHCPPGFHR